MADVVTFDPDALRIIEIDASGDNELSVQEIYSEWKQWLLDDPARLAYPSAFRYVGADPISENQSLGTTFFLTNGWRIRPAETNHKLTLVGNLFTDPAGDDAVVSTLSAFNVRVVFSVSNLVDSVFVNSADVQFSSFNQAEGPGVLVDVYNTTGLAQAGTVFPIGTARRPSNNFADALTIANARGLKTIYIVGQGVFLGGGLDFSGFHFQGQSSLRTSLVIDGSAQVNTAEFFELSVFGTLAGVVLLVDCLLGDVSLVGGVIINCGLISVITLLGGPFLVMTDCADVVGGTGTPTLDFGGVGQSVTIRDYKGGLTMRNKSGADEVSVDLMPGRLILESTITGGAFIVKGIGPATVNSSGGTATLNEDGLISPASVWDEAATGDIAARQMLSDLFRLGGLDAAKPLVVSATTRRVPGDGSEIDQMISEVAGVVTVQRV